MSKVSQTYTHPNIDDSDASYVTDPHSMADAFVTHFTAVSSDINHNNTCFQYKNAL